MTFSIAEDAIRAKIEAEWGRPTVPIVWQNETMVQPSVPYAIMSIFGTAEETVAFGGGRGNNEISIIGLVHGMFLVPIKGPIGLARDMRDQFCTMLRHQVFSGVHFKNCSPVGGGSNADTGKFYKLEALANFDYRFRG